MKSMMVFSVLCFLAAKANADDVYVIDSRRNIPLADTDPVYKDYYLNAGEGSGLKKDLVVTVVRKTVIRDAAGSQSVGEIDIPVAQLKVLAVYGKVTVARDYKPLSRDDYPMLEQVGVMAGDRVELKGSFVDAKKVPAKKVVQVAPPPEKPPEPVAAVAVTVETTAAPPVAPETPTEAAAPPEPTMASADHSSEH